MKRVNERETVSKASKKNLKKILRKKWKESILNKRNFFFKNDN